MGQVDREQLVSPCWSYDWNSDTWSNFSTGNNYHYGFPGASLDGKIYIAGNDFGTAEEVFDPATNVWSSWPKPSTYHGIYSCLLAWKDSLVLLGGQWASKTVEMFNTSSHTWLSLSSNAPIDIYATGCAVLPNEEIIVVASYDNLKSAFIYNVLEDKWRQVEDSLYDRSWSALVVLGSRVFAVGGFGDPQVVEEFIYSTESWKSVDARTLVERMEHSMISVPAELFAHLPGGCSGVM